MQNYKSYVLLEFVNRNVWDSDTCDEVQRGMVLPAGRFWGGGGLVMWPPLEAEFKGEPAVIPTAHASSFTLQYFPYYL